MRHFLAVNTLTPILLEQLIQRGQAIASMAPAQWYGLKSHGLTLVNLFYENSTRTRISFELAAKRLGIEVVNVDINTSSVQKGETVFDTIATLHAMSCQMFVIRHQQDHLPAQVAQHVGNSAHIINAGDGCNQHPTQALLDMLTISQHKADFAKLSVGIIGDIAHSRVANSDIAALQLLGCRDIRLIAPECFLPHTHQQLTRTTSLDQGLAGLDVVICLRVQQERIKDLAKLDLAHYQSQYCLTAGKLALAKPDAIVMHPGPINREVEIATAVADGKQAVILQQVHNGVIMRMALLEHLAGITT